MDVRAELWMAHGADARWSTGEKQRVFTTHAARDIRQSRSTRFLASLLETVSRVLWCGFHGEDTMVWS